MSKVVVSAALPGRIGEILRGHQLVGPAPGEAPWERDRILEELADAEALLPLLSVAVDPALIARAPRLRVIGNYAVGYDNVDLGAATRRGIVVTNTPGVLTEATAELALALLLAAARRLPEGEALARSGAWQGWRADQLLGLDLDGALLGVVGLGRIGRALGRRARACGLRLAYAAPRPASAEVEEELAAPRMPLRELLSQADVISLHCPLGPETHHLIDAAALGLMKPSAVLINTARGPIVDEGALAEALWADRLLAAGLDVYEREPQIEARLRAHPRVVLSPHLGSATVGTRTRMAELAAAGIADVLAGRRPAHPVNPEVLPAVGLAEPGEPTGRSPAGE